MSSSFDPEAAEDRLAAAFRELLAENHGGGASLALWRAEKPLLSLHGGEASTGIPWTATTPCLIWSASKGMAAAVTLHALQEREIPLTTPVCHLWTEFAASGKDRIKLAELLSHRSGLAAIDRKGLSITDHEGVAAALAAQPPNWEPDGGHGYGARTFGFLLDEIVRRTTGETLAERWERIFRAPQELDLWFGIPEHLLDATATVIAPKSLPSPGPFSRAFADPGSLTRRALSEPGGTLTAGVMNTPAMKRASLPSLGAIATAASLARFYSLLATDGGGWFRPGTLTAMGTTLAKGVDRVLLEETSFSAGFLTNAFGVYGPPPFAIGAFGHPGAGGSIAFADPEQGIGFAFVPGAMHPGALPGPRTRRLVEALYGPAV